MKTPAAARRNVVRWLQRCCEPRLRRVPWSDEAVPLRCVVWPPIRRGEDLRDVVERVTWFLREVERIHSILVPVASGELAMHLRDDIQFEPVSSGFRLGTLPSATIVLLWKTRSLRMLSLLAARRLAFFIIDPTLYASTEETEWRGLYTRLTSERHAATLRECSAENFRRLERDIGPGVRINVCGNGPNLERIFQHEPDYDRRDEINIICNGAVRSDRLPAHLRPKIIAFINSPYFGPSAFAREHMATVQRCMHEYGSYLVIPEGYAHHLVRAHYPAMASRVIALQLGRTLQLPTADALVAMASANVLTSLMLPIAAALAPSLIRVWGCDGQPRATRGTWAYLPGAEPKIESVATEHPAFVEGLRQDDRYLRRTYDAHGDHLERLLTHLEGRGLRIVCASPSAIPALARRPAA
jgi:hypothetical protein